VSRAQPPKGPQKVFYSFAKARRRIPLAVVAFVLLLASFHLHRTIKTLPPICPPFDDKPSRIVSLSLGTDELLVELVPPKRIRALTYLSVNPEFSNIAERARPYSRHEVSSVEAVANLRPDLLLSSVFNDPQKVESLQALGCKVVTVSGFESLDGIRRTILKVADSVGEREKGDALIARMDRTLQETARTHPQEDRKPVVLYAGPGGYTQGRDTVIHELIQRAGGINAAANMLNGLGRLSIEEWLAAKPDVLLRISYYRLDPFVVELFRTVRNGDPPAEVVMPSRLLTTVSPSSANAVGLLAEKLRKAMP